MTSEDKETLMKKRFVRYKKGAEMIPLCGGFKIGYLHSDVISPFFKRYLDILL